MITIHKSRYWVIIPAAGVGKRMNSTTPKQYIKIDQQTIIEHVVSLFSRHSLVEKVVVAVHKADMQWPRINMMHPEKVLATVGGETRAASVMAGLEYLQPIAASNDWVLVHDAARACLLSSVLDRFIKTVANHRIGGLLAMPVTDTVKKVDADGGVCETIPRQGLWAAQTPQMFRYSVLFDAMKAALSANAVITDEASAVEFVGEHPLIVNGDWHNIKITTTDDLDRAKEYWERL